MTTTTHPAPVHPAPDERPDERHQERPDERRLLAGGLLAGAGQLVATAFVLVFFATSHPAMDATPTEAARGFRDAAGMVGVGTWLTLASVPFLLAFLGALASVLHRYAGPATAATTLAAGVTAVVTTAAGAVVSAVTPAIGAEDTGTAAGAVVKALDGVMPLSMAAGGFPRAAVVLLAGLALARAGLLGRGLAGLTWPLAGLSLAGTLTLVTPAAFPLAALSALLFAAWVALVAAALRRRLG